MRKNLIINSPYRISLENEQYIYIILLRYSSCFNLYFVYLKSYRSLQSHSIYIKSFGYLIGYLF
jgi:hypothetical protein